MGRIWHDEDLVAFLGHAVREGSGATAAWGGEGMAGSSDIRFPGTASWFAVAGRVSGPFGSPDLPARGAGHALLTPAGAASALVPDRA